MRPPPLSAILLSAAAGVLHFLGFVGFGVWPLALLCFAVLWSALEQTRGSARRAAVAGFVFGWVSYAGGYLWLWRIVDVFLGGNLVLGAGVWFADSAWFALRYATHGVLYCAIRRRGAPVALAGPASLIVVEWLYPLLFPVHLGHALAERTLLVQMSELGGPLLMTAFASLLSAAALEAWRWRRAERARPAALLATAALAIALAVAYGAARIGAVDRAVAAAPKLTVGVVQGNLGVQEKGDDAERDHRLYLEQTRELLDGGAVDLVVWPETVHTRGIMGPLPVSGQLIRAELRVPLLLGAAFVGGESGERRKYNAAMLVGADGVVRAAYLKNLLIPFTEYVPFASFFPSLADRMASASHFSASAATPSLPLDRWRIATPICYEAVRPAFVRRMVIEGRPHLIVTLANDAWFGDSQGPWLHLAMARLRAVEHRRFMVRATNSGVSAIIDPIGRVVARTGLLTRENLRGTVAMLDETTAYARFGDWVGWGAAVIVLASLLRRERRGGGRGRKPIPPI